MALNTHKDFVNLIQGFKVKMGDFLEEVVYLKTNNDMIPTYESIRRRGMILAPSGFELASDGEYNHTVMYDLVIVDTVTGNINAVIESEESNLFVIGAFKDYLNYVKEGSVEFLSGDMEKISDAQGVTTTLSCKIVLSLTNSPTYWSGLKS